MKSIISATVLSIAVAAFATSASAAEVKGNVKTDVKVGVVLQQNTGIANKNETAVGSITGKNSKVSGNFSSTVQTGAIIQTNKGIANKNELAMGSVTD